MQLIYVFAQIAIGTNDVYKSAEAIKLCGGKIIREPGPLPGINTKIAVCLDPDGWKLVCITFPSIWLYGIYYVLLLRLQPGQLCWWIHGWFVYDM